MCVPLSSIRGDVHGAHGDTGGRALIQNGLAQALIAGVDDQSLNPLRNEAVQHVDEHSGILLTVTDQDVDTQFIRGGLGGSGFLFKPGLGQVAVDGADQDLVRTFFVAGCLVVLLAAAGNERKRHYQRQQQGYHFFHVHVLLFFICHAFA